jgi:hypothetical protein
MKFRRAIVTVQEINRYMPHVVTLFSTSTRQSDNFPLPAGCEMGDQVTTDDALGAYH